MAELTFNPHLLAFAKILGIVCIAVSIFIASALFIYISAPPEAGIPIVFTYGLFFWGCMLVIASKIIAKNGGALPW